jgi:hypothetical protein
MAGYIHYFINSREKESYIMPVISYTFISSNEASGGLVARLEGPDDPTVEVLYEEFLRVTKFPIRNREVPDFHEQFEKHWSWAKRMGRLYGATVYKYLGEYRRTGIILDDPTKAFVAWLIQERGFKILPDDSIRFCSGGPVLEDGVLTRMPRRGSYTRRLLSRQTSRKTLSTE